MRLVVLLSWCLSQWARVWGCCVQTRPHLWPRQLLGVGGADQPACGMVAGELCEGQSSWTLVWVSGLSPVALTLGNFKMLLPLFTPQFLSSNSVPDCMILNGSGAAGLLSLQVVRCRGQTHGWGDQD